MIMVPATCHLTARQARRQRVGIGAASERRSGFRLGMLFALFVAAVLALAALAMNALGAWFGFASALPLPSWGPPAGVLFLLGVALWTAWERHLALNALQLSERRNRQLVEGVQDYALYILSPSGHVLQWNESGRRLFGYTEAEAIGLHYASFFKPEDVEEGLPGQLLATAAREGKAGVITTRIKKNGETFIGDAVLSALYDEAGALMGYTNAVRDITQRVNVQKELDRQNRITRTITENAAAALFLVGADNRCNYLNPAAEQLTGYSYQEALGKTLHELIHQRHPDGKPYPADECRMVSILREQQAVKEQADFFVRKDGAVLPVVYSCQPIVESGVTVGSVIEVRDVSAEKEAENALKESEIRFRTMADSSPVLIWMADTEARFTYFNSSWLAFTGRLPEEETGEGWMENIHPEDARRYRDSYHEAFATRRTFRVEYRLRRHDGEYRWLLDEGLPRHTPDGAFQGFIGGCTDITEIVEAREILKRGREELEQLVQERTAQLRAVNKELEAFSYSVSHDLRSPLRSIDGFSQAVLEDYGERLDGTGKDYLQRVRQESQRMGRLIDDMLTLSRLTRSEMRVGTVSLSEMAEEVVVRLRSQNPERRVHFEVEPALTAEGDSGLLFAVLQNLLENAWKFSSPVPESRIRFGSLPPQETTGQGPVYFVEDNGVGFDPAYKDKLFGAFQRLHSMQEFPGTGVGLATVQRIIHRHGGRVWADSQPGRGATFYFTLHDSNPDNLDRQLPERSQPHAEHPVG